MKFKATIFAALMGFTMMTSLDAYAGKHCINSHDGTSESRKNPRVGANATLYGDICDIWRPEPIITQKPRHKPNWQFCINGIDIKTGRHCWESDSEWWNHGHRPRPITVQGPQAFDVLRNGMILNNHTNWSGWSTYLVKYFGHRRHSRLYNCRVSPNGRWAECTTTH